MEFESIIRDYRQRRLPPNRVIDWDVIDDYRKFSVAEFPMRFSVAEPQEMIPTGSFPIETDPTPPMGGVGSVSIGMTVRSTVIPTDQISVADLIRSQESYGIPDRESVGFSTCRSVPP